VVIMLQLIYEYYLTMVTNLHIRVYFDLNKFCICIKLFIVLLTLKRVEESMEKPELSNSVSLEMKVIFLMDVVAI